jgi:hypothetical protein
MVVMELMLTTSFSAIIWSNNFVLQLSDGSQKLDDSHKKQLTYENSSHLMYMFAS